MESNVLHNKNIKSISPLPSPTHYWRAYPITQAIQNQILEYRQLIEDILMHRNQKLIVIVGPCSIHDPVAGIEYAKKLKKIADEILGAAKDTVKDYKENPSDASGSVHPTEGKVKGVGVMVGMDSPYLNRNESGD